MEREGDNEPVNLKRGQNEAEMNNQGWKWRKREGIKRNLRDLPRQSYAECEDDCDEFDQSKKPKHGINCLLAALNQNVIRPLRKIDLQPISKQGLGSCVGEQGPPGRETKPPIGGLAVSDGTVPSATNRAGDGIQGGEKTNGGSSKARSVRSSWRGNNPTKYLWKTLILVLYLLGSALGGVSRIEREQAIIPMGEAMKQDQEHYHNEYWRMSVMMQPEIYLFSTPSIFRNQPDGNTDRDMKGCYRIRVSWEEG